MFLLFLVILSVMFLAVVIDRLFIRKKQQD